VAPPIICSRLTPSQARSITDRRQSQSTFASWASSLLSSFSDYPFEKNNTQESPLAQNSRIIGNPTLGRKRDSLRLPYRSHSSPVGPSICAAGVNIKMTKLRTRIAWPENIITFGNRGEPMPQQNALAGKVALVTGAEESVWPSPGARKRPNIPLDYSR
jgi:hypothetical protein